MQTEHLKITGMTCGGCSSSVARALNAVAGVSDVSLSLETGEAAVQYNEQLASPDQLRLAVKRAGYDVNTGSATQRNPVKSSCFQ